MAEILDTTEKIKSLNQIEEILEKERLNGSIIIQCHGVFDLLHPGHIRHFKAAKSLGDKLVITVTPDRFVNKGPGRPAFPEILRLESLAALQDVDYVVLNDSPDAVSAIQKVRPSLYVKGIEYADHQADVTGKISEEARAVEHYGGKIHYTNDIVFSSSSLLNRHFDPITTEAAQFLSDLKQEISLEEILERIESLRKLKVLVIGDAIIDEYQYAEPMGQTGKGHHQVARCLDREVFLGGSLVIANHLAQFSDHVTLLTAVGEKCPYLSYIKAHLDPKVNQELVYLRGSSTLVKKRYVLKDGQTISKLFETYSGQDAGPDIFQTAKIVDFLQKKASGFDLVLSADFGNGFSNPSIIDAISRASAFLALNTQTNSGNRGYNMITNYQRADYISLNEPELRLACHDKLSDLEGLAFDMTDIMSCKGMSVTRGVQGALCFAPNSSPIIIPAFASKSVDRVGAGDAYLSLSSLCLAGGSTLKLAGFIGTLAAAMSVQLIGNQEAIKKSSLCKFMTRLWK